MKYVWLHVTGPDGSDVLLAEHNDRYSTTYHLFCDDRTVTPECDAKGQIRIHKWILLKVEPCPVPEFKGFDLA